MAALMLPVPSETSRVLSEIPVPGNRTDQATMHITVMYLGKDVPIEVISDMIPVIFEVTSETAPLTVATNHVSNFPPGDDGVPIIAEIGSPMLRTFRKRLVSAFEDHGLPYDNKFPDYKPHTTLAFDPEKSTSVDIDIQPEIVWGAHELVLWGSNRGTDRLVIKFPLSLQNTKTANCAKDRALIQLAMWSNKDLYV